MKMGPKIPWSSVYKPPQTDSFATVSADDNMGKTATGKGGGTDDGGGANAESDDDSDDEGDDKSSDDQEDDGNSETKKDGNPGAIEDSRRRNKTDGGVGPFDADPQELWPNGMILEDRPFAEQMEDGTSAANELKEGQGWWSAKEETYYDEEAPPDVAQAQLPEPSDVGIDIPSSWVSKEWLEGRDAWIKKGGGEIERYLATSPFENYVLKRGCIKTNGQRSTLRDVGIFKVRGVLCPVGFTVGFIVAFTSDI